MVYRVHWLDRVESPMVGLINTHKKNMKYIHYSSNTTSQPIAYPSGMHTYSAKNLDLLTSSQMSGGGDSIPTLFPRYSRETAGPARLLSKTIIYEE